MLVVIAGVAITMAVAFAGPFLPILPIINAWPIAARVHTMRLNGIFEYPDFARVRKDRFGKWFYHIKGKNVKTEPKPSTDIQIGLNGGRFIDVMETSAGVYRTVLPKFEVDGKPLEGDTYRMMVQKESDRNWERAEFLSTINFLSGEPGFMQKYGGFVFMFVLIIGSILYFQGSMGPMNAMSDRILRADAQNQEFMNKLNASEDKLIILTDNLVKISGFIAGPGAAAEPTKTGG